MSNITINPTIDIHMPLGDNVPSIFQMVDDGVAIHERRIEEIAQQIYDVKERREMLELVTAVAGTACRVALIAGWEYGRAGIPIGDEG